MTREGQTYNPILKKIASTFLPFGTLRMLTEGSAEGNEKMVRKKIDTFPIQENPNFPLVAEVMDQLRQEVKREYRMLPFEEALAKTKNDASVGGYSKIPSVISAKTDPYLRKILYQDIMNSLDETSTLRSKPFNTMNKREKKYTSNGEVKESRLIMYRELPYRIAHKMILGDFNSDLEKNISRRLPEAINYECCQ